MTKKVITPYSDSEKTKKQQVTEMFNNISGKYDFLNHMLSFGIDKYWRRKTINRLKKYNHDYILDVATGTGDFAISALRLNPKKITGVDISSGMLEVGKAKVSRLNLDSKIEMVLGDSEELPFADNSFDVVTVAFGVRNFENLNRGLSEINRVLKPEGHIAVLEFSSPTAFGVKQFYWFYSTKILPFFGRIISKDKNAYTYLPESVKAFPYGQQFNNELIKVGFNNPNCETLSFGIASIYIAEK